MNKGYILAINPGSTSTKVAVFDGTNNIKQKNLSHNPDELKNYETISDQLNYRFEVIMNFLNSEGFNLTQFQSIVGRGGLLRPMPSGTYKVTGPMIEDLKNGFGGEHASNLGGQLAKMIGDNYNISSYIVDPVAVDEFIDVARISGMPELERKSQLHALNIRAVSLRVAKEKGFKLDDENIIVTHMGGGISVCPLKNGKMIDVNNALDNGPFSPERTGSLPVMQLVNLAYSGKYTYKEMKKKIIGQGGLVAYLGTNDARDVEKMISNGDEKAKLVYEAMAYQIAKEIGAMATALKGNVKYIILTGGLAYSKTLVNNIIESVKFIAPVVVEAGEDEMRALNEGVLRIMSGEEVVKIYENEVKIG